MTTIRRSNIMFPIRLRTKKRVQEFGFGHVLEGVFYSEMRYGTFERAIALPTTVKAEESKAEYHDGVVELTLPKKATESKGVKIRLE